MGEREKKLTTEDQKEVFDLSTSGLLYLTEWMEESLRTGAEEPELVIVRTPVAWTNSSWRGSSFWG